MTHPQNSWEAMYARLATFVKKHRHCNVPTNDPRDPQLGRWVAQQRYRSRTGALAKEQVQRLDALGFVWSASDRAWETHYVALKQFRQKFGHCDVPTKWAKNRGLADWVHRQRFRKKQGRLTAGKMQRLDDLNFTWAIYRGEGLRKAPAAKAAADSEEQAERRAQERLYRVRNGTYIQYGHKGKMPPALESYLKNHAGEYPPYIPLPDRIVQFILGGGWSKQRKIRWNGKGKLPPEVLAYVGEHGTLPTHD